MLAHISPRARFLSLACFLAVLSGCRQRDPNSIDPAAPAVPMVKTAAIWAIENPLSVAVVLVAIAVYLFRTRSGPDSPPSQP